MKAQVSTDVLMSHTSTCVESNLRGYSLLLLQHLYEDYKDQWPYRVCIKFLRTPTRSPQKNKKNLKKSSSLLEQPIFAEAEGASPELNVKLLRETWTQHDRSKIRHRHHMELKPHINMLSTYSTAPLCVHHLQGWRQEQNVKNVNKSNLQRPFKPPLSIKINY